MRNVVFLLLMLGFYNGFAQHDQTTVILVRHAEKGFDEGGDPSLTEEGTSRANELLRVLAHMSIDSIYTTPFKRTRETVQPLANAKNLPIGNYNPFKMEEVANIIKASKGKTLVFSGHSNTTPVIINMLVGNDSYKSLPESDYDNLYIVTFSEIGKAKVMHLEYGADVD